MIDHIADRALLLDSLRRELVGPDPRGKELDCKQSVTFETVDKSYGPWHQNENGEEVLQRDPPSKRYGIGVLYPAQTLDQDDAGVDALVTQSPEVPSDSVELPQDDLLTAQARKDLEDIQHRSSRSSAEPESEDLDLSSANSYRPSSIAVSFLASVPDGAKLIIEAKGGRYRRFHVTIESKERIWWLRSPVNRCITSRHAMSTLPPTFSRVLALHAYSSGQRPLLGNRTHDLRCL
jgi:hypothetical protein